eukprot:g5366.t1
MWKYVQNQTAFECEACAFEALNSSVGAQRLGHDMATQAMQAKKGWFPDGAVKRSGEILRGTTFYVGGSTEEFVRATNISTIHVRINEGGGIVDSEKPEQIFSRSWDSYLGWLPGFDVRLVGEEARNNAEAKANQMCQVMSQDMFMNGIYDSYCEMARPLKDATPISQWCQREDELMQCKEEADLEKSGRLRKAALQKCLRNAERKCRESCYKTAGLDDNECFKRCRRSNFGEMKGSRLTLKEMLCPDICRGTASTDCGSFQTEICLSQCINLGERKGAKCKQNCECDRMVCARKTEIFAECLPMRIGDQFPDVSEESQFFEMYTHPESLETSVHMVALDYYDNAALLESDMTCSVFENTARSSSDAEPSEPKEGTADKGTKQVTVNMGKQGRTMLPSLAAELDNFRQVAEQGVVDFSDLRVRGAIGFNYPLEIKCSIATGEPVLVNLIIGPCHPGEELLDAKKECRICPAHTYSTRGEKCLPCPSGGECTRSLQGSQETVVGVAEPRPRAGWWMSFAPKHLIDGNQNANRDFWNNVPVPEDLAGDGEESLLSAPESRRLQNTSGSSSSSSSSSDAQLVIGHPSRAGATSHTPYCDWDQGHCLPGERLDPIVGCVPLKGYSADRIYACTEGVMIYLCPGREHSCSETSTKELGNGSTAFDTGNCNPGYVGLKCSSCAWGYYAMSDGTCAKCIDVGGDSSDPDLHNRTLMFYGVSAGLCSVTVLFVLYLYLRRDDGDAFIRRLKNCFGFSTRRRRIKHFEGLQKDAKTGSYADEQRAKMWFRPEKFKIMLAFAQIFSQMKNNYGVQWSSSVAEYMRLFAGFNIDIVKLAAVDCIYRSNFFFGLVVALAFPSSVAVGLYMIHRVGRKAFQRALLNNPRKCVRTGEIVEGWMSKKEYKRLVRESAKKSLQADDVDDDLQLSKKGSCFCRCASKAERSAQVLNSTGLPTGSSVSRPYYGHPGVIDMQHLQLVIESNIRVWKVNLLHRIEYMRFTNKIFKLYFWIMLLAYPSISVRILRLFACEEIGNYVVLIEDMGIRCYSTRWFMYASVAFIAGMGFIAGIPALFLLVLYRAREKGIRKQWTVCMRFPKRRELLLKEAEEDARANGEFWSLDADGDGDHTLKEEEHAIKTFLRRVNMRFHRTYERLGFIYYSYTESTWWYELVELSRKLVLNGLIVLVPEGLSTRVVVGVLACFAYIVVLNFFAPYKCSSDHTLQNAAHIQLFFTAFLGFLLKAEVPFLGFSPFLRQVEGEVITVAVILSHLFVCTYGLGVIIWERFFSAEIQRLAASRKKRDVERKRRMMKFKRVKRSLLSNVRTELSKRHETGMESLLKNLTATPKAEKEDGAELEDNLDGLDFGFVEDERTEIAQGHDNNEKVESTSKSVLDAGNDSGSGSANKSESESESESESGSSSGSGSGSGGDPDDGNGTKILMEEKSADGSSQDFSKVGDVPSTATTALDKSVIKPDAKESKPAEPGSDTGKPADAKEAKPAEPGSDKGKPVDAKEAKPAEPGSDTGTTVAKATEPGATEAELAAQSAKTEKLTTIPAVPRPPPVPVKPKSTSPRAQKKKKLSLKIESKPPQLKKKKESPKEKGFKWNSDSGDSDATSGSSSSGSNSSGSSSESD